MRETTHPKVLVEQSISDVMPMALQKEVKISTFLDTGLGQIIVDPSQIRRVLTNLLSNAVKFSYDGGVVEVHATRRPALDFMETGGVFEGLDDDWTEFSVVDHGVGIPNHERDRVFDAFYQVESSAQSVPGGTGLGLSIVKHLVTSMGGQVGMEPNHPQGSVFWLTVPSLNRP